jgi:hypothetical protein
MTNPIQIKEKPVSQKNFYFDYLIYIVREKAKFILSLLKDKKKLKEERKKYSTWKSRIESVSSSGGISSDSWGGGSNWQSYGSTSSDGWASNKKKDDDEDDDDEDDDKKKEKEKKERRR